MLISTLLTIAMLLQPATAPTTAPSRVSPDAAVAAIDRFLANPVNGDDVQTIMKFAQESDDVEVHVDPHVQPWLGKKPPYPAESAFLISFVAGSVKSQLTSHKKGDDAYAGVLTVLSTYEKMRAKNQTAEVPEIEEMGRMEKRGELKDHIAKLVKDRANNKAGDKGSDKGGEEEK